MPITHRCIYCRPYWTYGVQDRLLRKVIAFVWPPHIIGPDFGPPYTDVHCPAAAARENARQDAAELKVWQDRWDRWNAAADRAVKKSGVYAPVFRVLAYQYERRHEMKRTII